MCRKITENILILTPQPSRFDWLPNCFYNLQPMRIPRSKMTYLEWTFPQKQTYNTMLGLGLWAWCLFFFFFFEMMINTAFNQWYHIKLSREHVISHLVHASHPHCLLGHGWGCLAEFLSYFLTHSYLEWQPQIKKSKSIFISVMEFESLPGFTVFVEKNSCLGFSTITVICVSYLLIISLKNKLLLPFFPLIRVT